MPNMTEETLAAWLDNMMPEEESREFMARFGSDPALSEVLDVNDNVVESYEAMIEEGFEYPAELDTDFDLPFTPATDMFNDSAMFSDSPWVVDDASEDYEEYKPADFQESSESEETDLTTLNSEISFSDDCSQSTEEQGDEESYDADGDFWF